MRDRDVIGHGFKSGGEGEEEELRGKFERAFLKTIYDIGHFLFVDALAIHIHVVRYPNAKLELQKVEMGILFMPFDIFQQQFTYESLPYPKVRKQKKAGKTAFSTFSAARFKHQISAWRPTGFVTSQSFQVHFPAAVSTHPSSKHENPARNIRQNTNYGTVGTLKKFQT